MKISSWNVNSVRARITNILNYLKNSKPDILLMQEIKTEENKFPFNEFKNLGYKSYVFGQKSYNGVAFLSKINIDKINLQFINDEKKQSRIISGLIKNKSNIINLINIYVPNGNPINTEKYDYKKKWFDSFNKKIEEIISRNKNIIIAGDFNVIPEEIDVYNHKKYENDALFKLEIRKKFRHLVNLGFHDVFRYQYKDKVEYTFWDYMSGSWTKNHGMRIDHFLISTNLLNIVKSININSKPRSELKPSDHTPIELIIN
tara:strand:+ start:15430 stop:16206 length:777 start_codon:yes stop_codon:yes gene_type:complete